MPITIKDIAKEAGVSHTTVSRALHNHPAIAADTAVRIQEIADELGYVPNSMARVLKNNQSDMMGVIVRRIVDPFFSEVLNGIESVFYKAGYSLFLASSNRDLEREKNIIRTMSEHRVAGVIICSTAAGEEHRTQLQHFNVPSVLINNQTEAKNDSAIYNDNIYGARQIMHHLLELGHRRIAYLGNVQGGLTTAERLSGYKRMLIEASIPLKPEYIVNAAHGQVEDGAMAAQALLTLPERPTAVMCYNDLMAVGAMRTLHQAGLQIPLDCSITGFDNIEISGYTNPALTTFDQPKYELGRQAAMMMLDILRGQKNTQRPQFAPEKNLVILKGNLVVRESTASPPEKR